MLKFDITDGDRTTVQTTRDRALVLGYSEEIIQAAEARARAVLVSKECRRRIYTIASVETQMNMAAASAVISSKTASTRSDEEKAVLAGLEAAIGWVAQMRATVAALASNPENDFADDSNWPAPPDAALAVVEKF